MWEGAEEHCWSERKNVIRRTRTRGSRYPKNHRMSPVICKIIHTIAPVNSSEERQHIKSCDMVATAWLSGLRAAFWEWSVSKVTLPWFCLSRWQTSMNPCESVRILSLAICLPIDVLDEYLIEQNTTTLLFEAANKARLSFLCPKFYPSSQLT